MGEFQEFYNQAWGNWWHIVNKDEAFILEEAMHECIDAVIEIKSIRRAAMSDREIIELFNSSNILDISIGYCPVYTLQELAEISGRSVAELKELLAGE